MYCAPEHVPDVTRLGICSCVREGNVVSRGQVEVSFVGISNEAISVFVRVGAERTCLYRELVAVSLWSEVCP